MVRFSPDKYLSQSFHIWYLQVFLPQSNEGEWWSSSTPKQPSSLFPPSILRSSSSEKEEKEEKQPSLLPPSILRSSPHSSTEDPRLDLSSNAKEKEEEVEKVEREEKVEQESNLKAEKLDTEVRLSHFRLDSFNTYAANNKS